MNRDAIERLALERQVKISAELEVQLDGKPGMSPMIAMLSIAREQAAEAIRGLIYVDPTDSKQVREFQFEVRRYDDLVEWAKGIIITGKEADRKIREDEKREFADILNSPEVQEEIEALGGNPLQDA